MPRDFTQCFSSQENIRRNPIINRTLMMQKIKQMDSVDQKTKRQNIENIRKQDIENFLPLKGLTKKISKVANGMTLKNKQTTPRKPFADVTNRYGNSNDSSSSSEKTPKVNASFLEDEVLQKNLNSGSATVKKTYHHAILSFANKKETMKVYQFSCFLDKELNIPEKYSMRTINHSIDNDVETDDDQINSAIRNVSNAIEEAYQEHKKLFQQQQQLQYSQQKEQSS